MSYLKKTETLHALKRRNPDLAKSIIERHEVPDSMLAKIHVLSFWAKPGEEAMIAEGVTSRDAERSVSTVVLLNRKLEVRVYGTGTAIKAPEDDEHMSRGWRIALGRALGNTRRGLLGGGRWS